MQMQTQMNVNILFPTVRYKNSNSGSDSEKDNTLNNNDKKYKKVNENADTLWIEFSRKSINNKMFNASLKGFLPTKGSNISHYVLNTQT